MNYLMNSVYLMIISFLVSINPNSQINFSWRMIVVCLFFQVKHWVFRTTRDIVKYAHDASDGRIIKYGGLKDT